MNYACETSRHNNISCINNDGDNKIIYLNTVGTNEIYTQVDHILDNNHISSHANNMGNNTINTISTFGTIDKHTQLVSNNGTSNSYTQVDYTVDTSRHNNIYRTNHTDNNKVIYQTTLGTSGYIPRWASKSIIVLVELPLVIITT